MLIELSQVREELGIENETKLTEEAPLHRGADIHTAVGSKCGWLMALPTVSDVSTPRIKENVPDTALSIWCRHRHASAPMS